MQLATTCFSNQAGSYCSSVFKHPLAQASVSGYGIWMLILSAKLLLALGVGAIILALL